jgi:23S rRNA G2445 N2-methylase RlmL
VAPRADLRNRLSDPGFTPSVKDTDGLVELLHEEEDVADRAERVLLRIGPKLAPRAIALAEKAAPRVRARLVRVAGRLDAPEIGAFLLRAAHDADPKTRRNALAALGRARTPEAEEALLDAWRTETNAPILKTIAASLGKLGTPRALDALRARPPGIDADPELAKTVSRASRTVARDVGRGEASAIDETAGAKVPLPILFFCRPGLQPICAEELDSLRGGWSAQAVGPGEVRAVLRGPLASVLASRTATQVGFPLAPVESTGDLAEAVARAIASDAARTIFRTFTRGVPRYRLAFAEGGHKRATVWKIAELVQARAQELVNDPKDSTWEAVVRMARLHRAGAPRRDEVSVVLVPRRLVDPRFAYRVAEVPAASHPTIAAALAFLGGAREDDVVWDPFVGSGLELVERARLGPWASLLGTDTDPRALAAAAKNLADARVEARLERADALDTTPPGVTLLLTNPPMGRRVRAGDHEGLAPFLERFIAHAARVLVPGRGARFVWVSPRGALTRAAAKRAGFVLERSQPIVMGTHEAEIQRFSRP